MSDCCGETRIINTGGGGGSPLLRDNTQTSPDDRSGFDYTSFGLSLDAIAALQTGRPETRNPAEISGNLLRHVPDHYSLPVAGATVSTGSSDLSALIGAGWTILGTGAQTVPINGSGRVAVLQFVSTMDVIVGAQGVHIVEVWRTWGNPLLGGNAAPGAFAFPLGDPTVQRQQGEDSLINGFSPSLSAVDPNASIAYATQQAAIAPAEQFQYEFGVAVWVDASYVPNTTVAFDADFRGLVTTL